MRSSRIFLPIIAEPPKSRGAGCGGAHSYGIMVSCAGPVKVRRHRNLTEENDGRYNRGGFITANNGFHAKAQRRKAIAKERIVRHRRKAAKPLSKFIRAFASLRETRFCAFTTRR
jgi:hypothetical protein